MAPRPNWKGYLKLSLPQEKVGQEAFAAIREAMRNDDLVGRKKVKKAS